MASPPPNPRATHSQSPFPGPQTLPGPHHACCLGIRGVTLVAGVLLLRDSRWGAIHMIPAPKRPWVGAGSPYPPRGAQPGPRIHASPGGHTHKITALHRPTVGWTDRHTHTHTHTHIHVLIHTSLCVMDKDGCGMLSCNRAGSRTHCCSPRAQNSCWHRAGASSYP